jgi:hypothetical protein
MASLTDSEILEQYKVARDAIVAAIAAGRDVIEYQVMSQRRKSADPVAELRLIEQQIVYYERRVAGATSGRARNYAQIHRR